jgi:hypothetical protein
VAAALGVALVSARHHAGGWNDGSRLATVECLVDYHTFAIDRSVFVDVPSAAWARRCYGRDEAVIRQGTLDKLYIHGHYYSDKSPVPAVLMAGVYWLYETAGGAAARVDPQRFCFVLTLMTSGAAYVAGCLCVFAFGQRLGLSLPISLALAASFGLSTVALPYTRHVNNHILFLGAVSPLVLGLVRWSSDQPGRSPALGHFLFWGWLSGLCYTIDLGAGPLLLASVLVTVAWFTRSVRGVGLVIIGAVPWLALHHVLNYHIGGTLGPANAVAEYFRWPGCPFDEKNMTGTWHHLSWGHFFLYAAGLLLGKRGFIGHNPVLYLAVPMLIGWVVKRSTRSPVCLFAFLWCGGTWLIYALTSTNSSGPCCSIRWFVPLLVPAYGMLAFGLLKVPGLAADVLLLSLWGALEAVLMWRHGPWMEHMVAGYWFIQAGTLTSWAWLASIRWQRRHRQQQEGLQLEKAA